MARYRPGSLEEAIKNLIADALTSGLETEDQQDESDQGSQEERGGIRERGRVKHPESDRRLKENRGREEAA